MSPRGRRGIRRTCKLIGRVMCLGALLLVATGTMAAEQETEPAAADEGPPLPLHTVEGVGGVFITPFAYLVNPGPAGTVIGKPAVSTHWARIGQKDLETLTLTWTLWRRLELGYGINRLGLADLDHDIRLATGVDIRTNDILLHHFNARLNVIEENNWELGWLPAVTVGAHLKYNEDVEDIDRRLDGVLSDLGLEDDYGVDFTLTATKTLTFLPRPVMVSAGARASKATHIGLFGFTDDYRVTFEGNAAVFLTDRLILAAEYRQKESDLDSIPGLFDHEDPWWTVCACYIINDRMTIGAGYGDFGTVANHKDEQVFAACFKYEF